MERDFRQEKIIRNQELSKIQGQFFKEIVHSSIGSLTFLNKNKKMGVGSAVLISPNLMLTAAHNIYDKKYKCQNTDFKFYLAANGIVSEFYEIQSWRYLQEFKECSNQNRLEFDYALMKLKKRAPLETYLPLTSACQHCLLDNNKGTLVQIYGYPDSCGKNYKPINQFGEKMHLHQYGQARKNRIIYVNIKSFTIAYAISTLPGQSGSPVCVNNSIIAIHIGGGKQSDQYNVGRLITSDLIDNLQKWKKEMDGRYFTKNERRLCPYADQTVLDLNNIVQEQRREIQLLKNRCKQLEQRLNDTSQHNEQLLHREVQNILKNAAQQQDQILDLRQKKLNSIELTNLTSILYLHLQNNKLCSIDLSNNIHLIKLKLNSNILKQIDLTKNTKLEQLYLHQNYLASIDLKWNIQLTTIHLNHNKIRQIDLSANKQLQDLALFQNLLEFIDLSHNCNLIFLGLSQNKLKELDLRKNTQLVHLYLHQNELQSIDLVENIYLEQLYLHKNKLKFIIFYWHPDLQTLYLQNQHSEECEVKLCHHRDQATACNEFMNQLIPKQAVGKNKFNIHKCKYKFFAVEEDV